MISNIFETRVLGIATQTAAAGSRAPALTARRRDMKEGKACRLCGKIIGGNAGSMVRHQATWQCAAGRPKNVLSATNQHKRMRTEQPPEELSYADCGDPDAPWQDFDVPAADVSADPSSEWEQEDIVPAPVPSPHDPAHAARKRMRLRFREILQLTSTRNEAAIVSDQPITSTEVPDAEYDAEDETTDRDEIEDRNQGESQPVISYTAAKEKEARKATEILRDHIQVLFHPPSGAGLPAAKRKEVIQIVQLALTAGRACPNITVLDLFPDRGGESISGTLSSIDNQFRKHMMTLTHDDGWVSQDFSVKGGAATCHWNTRAVEALALKVSEMLDIIDCRSRWNGHTFSHPTSGAFMREFTEILEFQRKAYGDWDPTTDLPIMLTYFSDGTLLANKGSMSAHPVIVGIGNVPAESYPGTFVTLGYLDPKMEFQPGLSEDEAAQVKRALVAQQVGAMLEQFKRCSFMGYKLEDHNGKTLRMFTGLFDCAIDNPEVSLLLGHKSG